MQKKNLFLRLVCISLFIFLAGSVACAATTITVEVEGVGFATGNDSAAARDRAINDARLRAIEQALGARVDSRTVIHRSLLIDDTLLTTSHGMVKQYTILKEGMDEHGLYRVAMRAVVDREELDNRLQQAAGARRILLLMPEAGAPDTNGQHIQNCIRAFVDAGFTLVPGTVTVKNFSLLDRKKIRHLAAPKNIDLVLGIRLQADSPTCPAAGYCATRVRGSLHLWSGKNGVELARAEKTDGRGFGNTGEIARAEGLRATGRALADSLVEQLFHPPVRELKLALKRLPDINTYQQMLARIAGLRWVQQARPDSVGFHPGKSVFLLRFAGSPDLLGAMLEQMRNYTYLGRTGNILTLEYKKQT